MWYELKLADQQKTKCFYATAMISSFYLTHHHKACNPPQKRTPHHTHYLNIRTNYTDFISAKKVK